MSLARGVERTHDLMLAMVQQTGKRWLRAPSLPSMSLMLLRALRGKEGHYGTDHLQVASMSVMLLRALRGKEAHYSKDHLQVAITLSNLSNVHGLLVGKRSLYLMFRPFLSCRRLLLRILGGTLRVRVAGWTLGIAAAFGA